jgi:hypothetical protein
MAEAVGITLGAIAIVLLLGALYLLRNVYTIVKKDAISKKEQKGS